MRLLNIFMRRSFWIFIILIISLSVYAPQPSYSAENAFTCGITYRSQTGSYGENVSITIRFITTGPDETGYDENVKVDINWGDGTSKNTYERNQNNSTQYFTYNHIYSAGNYSINLTATATYLIGGDDVCTDSDGPIVVTAPVYGCMDSAASNYNSSATVDDGSCTYTGTVCFTSNIDTSVTISGGGGMSGTGKSGCFYDKPMDSYTATGTSQGGYTGPTYSPSQTQSLTSSGQTITFALSYTAIVGGGGTCTDLLANNYNEPSPCTYTPSYPSCGASFTPSNGTVGSNTTFAWNYKNDADGVLTYSCTGSFPPGFTPAGSVSDGSGSVVIPIPSDSQTCTFTANNGTGTSSTCTANITSGPLTGTVIIESYCKNVKVDPHSMVISASMPTWSGSGPITTDYFLSGLPVGQYTVGFLDGYPLGCNEFQGILPSNTQYLGGDSTITFKFRFTNDEVPVGSFDGASCDLISGWAFDPDTSSDSLAIHLYKDGPAGSGTFVSSIPTTEERPDVNSIHGITGNHQFAWRKNGPIFIPPELVDGLAHTVYAYAINSNSSKPNTSLGSKSMGPCYPPPTLNLSCSNPVVYNTSGTLSWSSTNVSSNSCDITGGSVIGSSTGLPASGTKSTTALLEDTSYTITCQGLNGTSINRSAVCDVGLPPAPTCSLGAAPNPVSYNTASTLTWSVPNSATSYPTSCTASGDWSGSKSVLGGTESTGALTSVKTYNLTCTGPGGTGSVCSATVDVIPPVPNAPNPVTVTAPDYCTSGPAATINWVYSDSSGSPQSAYEVQLDEEGSFTDPEYETGKVLSSSTSNFTGQGVLEFNKTYKARVRVWNSYDQVSSWAVMSGNFKTPPYAYPQVNFTWTANGISENPSPPLGKVVQFTDQTVFNGNPNGRRWDWTFDDGSSSDIQNPAKTYNTEGSYYVTLTATDNANQTCSCTDTNTCATLILQKPIPKWREIAPR